MIIVPPDHAVIRESIVKHLASKKRDYIDVSYVTDFDGTVYKLSSGSPEDPDNKDMLCMSIQVVGFDEIVASMGGPEFLQDPDNKGVLWTRLHFCCLQRHRAAQRRRDTRVTPSLRRDSAQLLKIVPPRC